MRAGFVDVKGAEPTCVPEASLKAWHVMVVRERRAEERRVRPQMAGRSVEALAWSSAEMMGGGMGWEGYVPIAVAPTALTTTLKTLGATAEPKHGTVETVTVVMSAYAEVARRAMRVVEVMKDFIVDVASVQSELMLEDVRL